MDKLYSALETGKLDLEDLAPRIKELRANIDGLERKRLEAVEGVHDTKVELLGASVVKAYMKDLKALLSKGSIVEQHEFLRSFIKRIGFTQSQVAIDYTFPLKKTKKVELLGGEVLPFARFGSPYRTRTSGKVDNSYPLYR